MKKVDQFPEHAKSDLTYLVDYKNRDRILKQLLKLVIANNCDFSVSCRSIICLSLWLWQISGNGNHIYVLHISLYDSPLCRLSTGQRCFAFGGANLWNSLNDNIKSLK